MVRIAYALMAIALAACGSVEEKPPAAVDAGSDDGGANHDGSVDAPVTSTCSETFSANTVNTAIWAIQDPDNQPVSVTQTEGRLRVNVAANAQAANAIISVDPFSYAGASVQFQILAIPADGEVTSSVSLSDAGSSVRVAIYAPNILAFATNLPMSTKTVSTSDTYVRMRDDGGVTTFETAADGINWTVRHTATTPVMSSARLGIGAGIDVGTGGIFEVDTVSVTVVGVTCPLE